MHFLPQTLVEYLLALMLGLFCLLLYRVNKVVKLFHSRLANTADHDDGDWWKRGVNQD